MTRTEVADGVINICFVFSKLKEFKFDAEIKKTFFNRYPVTVPYMGPISRSESSRVVNAIEYSSFLQKKSWVGILRTSA